MLKTSHDTESDSSGSSELNPWLHLSLVILGGLVLLMLVRTVFVGPVDNLAVRQACAAHARSSDHPLKDVDVESSFGPINRFGGECSFGPSEDGEQEAFTTTLDELNPGGFYTAAKYLGLFLMIGSMAVYFRAVGEPIYRKFVSESSDVR